MPDSPLPIHGYRLAEGEAFQSRVAQDLDPKLSERLREVCQNTTEISKCYLLNGRKPPSDAIFLLIAPVCTPLEAYSDSLAKRIAGVIQEFPEWHGNAFVMNGANFQAQYSGSEFYERPGLRHKVIHWLARRLAKSGKRK